MRCCTAARIIWMVSDVSTGGEGGRYSRQLSPSGSSAVFQIAACCRRRAVVLSRQGSALESGAGPAVHDPSSSSRFTYLNWSTTFPLGRLTLSPSEASRAVMCGPGAQFISAFGGHSRHRSGSRRSSHQASSRPATTKPIPPSPRAVTQSTSSRTRRRSATGQFSSRTSRTAAGARPKSRPSPDSTTTRTWPSPPMDSRSSSCPTGR